MSSIVFLAVLLMSCSQFASQLYMPVLPDIAKDLALSSSASQAVIVSFFITLGLTQLIAGPLRDKYGDRHILIAGQLILVAGTLICGFAESNWQFLLGRVLQGIGSASPVLISRTLLAQYLTGAKLKSAMASLAMAASITAILSPMIAGTLAQLINWQGLSFIMVLHFALVLWLGFVILPKSQKNDAHSIRPRALASLYKSLLQDKNLILLANFKWLPTYLYLTIQLYLPFYLQAQFQFNTEQIGYAMMLPMAGLLVGSSLAKIMQKRMSYMKIVKLLWPALPIAAFIFEFSHISALVMLFAYTLVMMVFGAYFPSYMHIIGLLQPEKAGSANALVGAIELLFFTAIAWLTNVILFSSQHILPLIVLTCSMVLWFCWKKLSLNLTLCER
ncbi:MFS transporter [Pseudoalteromonas phenolica]|uniref:Major facilitator transporter n=1 Tax=Pseudoalteromonas phenolica TaxID=161398 RepID=A0A0S2K8J2_9GAMM|nr:MFS transporter [Pseudoalteromonas phenolica]ALO44303.1 Major facilitator transporter [Pseudoalteromonas phenolica]MBE0357301.1 hypothetical protein [Pseudoalteromonas phenolica O-BC30]RXE92115.1 MFS transporter [Pseudoalteromonas phenolica O-BC30]